MEQQMNYPVKYAILKLEARKDRNAYYRNVVYGFIASKCYVVEKNVNYGTNKTSYKVVFPHNDIMSFIDSSRDLFSLDGKIKPSYNENGELENCTTVTQLFDTFEEAKDLAYNLRKDYQFVLMLPSNSKLSYKAPICKGLKLNEEYERLIELATQDMIVTENLEEKEHNGEPLFI